MVCCCYSTAHRAVRGSLEPGNTGRRSRRLAAVAVPLLYPARSRTLSLTSNRHGVVSHINASSSSSSQTRRSQIQRLIFNIGKTIRGGCALQLQYICMYVYIFIPQNTLAAALGEKERDTDTVGMGRGTRKLRVGPVRRRFAGEPTVLRVASASPCLAAHRTPMRRGRQTGCTPH